MFDLINNKKTFKYGQDDYDFSRRAAEKCLLFKEDDEDEQVDSIIRSCYNCRYRRWTSSSFVCLK